MPNFAVVDMEGKQVGLSLIHICITVWAGFADGMPVLLYSLIYNGLYMLPEFGILIAAAIALGLLVKLTPTISASP